MTRAPGNGPSRHRGSPARAHPDRRPAGRRAPAVPARRAAYDLLRAVHVDDAYANLTLPSLLRRRRLESHDAALATELGYGTLRWQGNLDAVLSECVDRPLDRVDGPLLDLCRLGAYQALRTRVPPHAAVSTTVDLARTVLGAGQARFVNAVLRRVVERDWAGWLPVVTSPLAGDPAGRLGVEYGYPAWVVRAFADALGGWEELPAALADDRPPVHLAARPGRIGRDELVAEAGAALGDRHAADALALSPYGVLLRSGDPHRIPAIRDGRAGVQDEGSQLAALAVARAELGGPDARWLDAAAGPGGKAVLLAGLARERGAVLIAADVHPHRARLAAQALGGPSGRGGAFGNARARVRNATAPAVVVADGRVPAWPDRMFDRVLVDAPCSGLGSLRRRPEVRWRRTAADIEALVPLQRTLLRSALAAVRPGGIVGYVTCSPHPAETHDIIADVLADGAAEPVDARPTLAAVPDLGDGPAVQLWPHRHGTDAMFIALLRRR